MKTLLTFVFAALLYSCAPQQELQGDLVDATLINVDTEHRYPYTDKKMLTWKTSNDLTIITFAPQKAYYPVGTKMKMLLPR